MRTITLGGHEIKIIVLDSYLDDAGNALYGCFNEREGVIYISRQAGSLMGQTLIHEIMHAIDAIFNNKALNEDTTDALSQGVYQLLKGGDIFKALKGEDND